MNSSETDHSHIAKKAHWVQGQCGILANQPSRKAFLTDPSYTVWFVYTPAHADLSPADSMAYWLHEMLREAHLPDPTFVVSNGRGFDGRMASFPCPSGRLTALGSVPKSLVYRTQALRRGSGRYGCGAGFRLVGMVNGRARQVVTALTPIGESWDFENLAFEILPLTRTEVSDLRVQRALRQAEKPRRENRPPRKDFYYCHPLGSASERPSAAARIALVGRVAARARDLWLFLAITAMSWLTVDPKILYREARALALRTRLACHAGNGSGTNTAGSGRPDAQPRAERLSAPTARIPE